MQRRLRYQSAYGVVLISAAVRQQKPYIALWCENHEDLLGEREDSLYDGYQIKTQKPERGAWQMLDDDLKKSIKRFVELDQKFPGKIHNFFFVSNANFSDSVSEKQVGRSPIHFLQEVQAKSSASDIPSAFQDTFDKLCKHCSCSADQLLQTLHKLYLVKGPSLDAYEAEIVQDHLSTLPDCEGQSVDVLKHICKNLIARIFEASSLMVDDPSRHWACVNGADVYKPELKAKRVSVESVRLSIREKLTSPFRLVPVSDTVHLGHTQQNVSVLEQKMRRGGIFEHFDTMQNRMLSAERHLLELVNRNPHQGNRTINHVSQVVQGVCSDADLEAGPERQDTYGFVKLREVHRRLREIATSRPDKVDHQEYECLMGIVGMLTNECKVWWSTKFYLETDV